MALPLTTTPTPTPKSEQGGFVVMEGVPFFKEHVNRDGVKIDREALERICYRCNKRIADTGDFPPIVVNHTKDDGSNDPDVVGFASTFYVGTVGNVDPKAAILGKMHIFSEDIDQAKKHPRRSVEYWATVDDPTNGYFDPISLLGATTPELDLGLHYSKPENGVERRLRYQKIEAEPIRYEAGPACPGGSNTMIASGTNIDDKKKIKNAKESDDMAADTPPSTPGFNPQNTEQFLNQFVAAMTPLMRTMVQEEVASAQGKGDGELSAAPGEEEDDDVEAGETPPEDLSERPEEETAEGPPPEDDDEQDDDEPEVPPKAVADDKKPPDEKKKKYEADTEKMTQYAKLGDIEKVERYHRLVCENRDLQTQYAKLKSEVDGAKAERRKAVRYSKLKDLKGQGFVFDVEEEMADCGALDDASFERHIDRIVNKYQRIPGGMIPIEEPKIYDGKPIDQAAKEKSQKYSKQARENVERERAKGNKIEYRDELARLIAADKAAA